MLGGHGKGPVAVVHFNDWAALVRLALSSSIGWYRAWEKGEWSSPDPVPLFDLFMRNGRSLGSIGRARGPWRWVNRAVHALQRNTRLGAMRHILNPSSTGKSLYSPWLYPGTINSMPPFPLPN